METFLRNYSLGAINFVPKMLLMILTLVIGFGIAGVISELIENSLTKRRTDESIIAFLRSSVSIIIKIVVLISIAGIFGIETSSFVAVLAAASFAIGLAIHGSLGHFASGILIFIFRPYKIGNLVIIGNDFTGEVVDIQMFSTILMTPNNQRIFIPNGIVMSAPITNISGQGVIRVDMQFSVSEKEDIDRVKKLILDVSKTCNFVDKWANTEVLVNSLSVGTTKFDVRIWTNYNKQWDVYYFMQDNVKRQFVLQNIQMPQPAVLFSLPIN